MRIIDDLDFEPPFANPEPEKEEVSDTYIDCTIDLKASHVEFLSSVLIEYISLNVEWMDNDEWIEVTEIQELLMKGTIPGRPA